MCFYLIGHSKLVPHLMRYVMGCISPVWPVGLCAIYVANGTVSLIVTRAWVTVVSFIALPVAQSGLHVELPTGLRDGCAATLNTADELVFIFYRASVPASVVDSASRFCVVVGSVPPVTQDVGGDEAAPVKVVQGGPC